MGGASHSEPISESRLSVAGFRANFGSEWEPRVVEENVRIIHHEHSGFRVNGALRWEESCSGFGVGKGEAPRVQNLCSSSSTGRASSRSCMEASLGSAAESEMALSIAESRGG